MTPVRLEPVAFPSQVKHSTTALPKCSFAELLQDIKAGSGATDYTVMF